MTRLRKALQGLVRSVSGCVGKLLLPRVERCRCWVVGRPELAGVEPAVVAGVRAWVRAALRCASKRAEALMVAYVMR